MCVEHLQNLKSQPFLFEAQQFVFFRVWLFMALLLHKCLLKEEVAAQNLIIASEIKVETCLLLAELSELVPKTDSPGYQKFKDILCELCDYCQKVCDSHGLLPFHQRKFNPTRLSEDELAEIRNALEALWVESEGYAKFHVYRCLDTATDFCFQLGARLGWESAAHLGCRFQYILGSLSKPVKKDEVESDMQVEGDVVVIHPRADAKQWFSTLCAQPYKPTVWTREMEHHHWGW